MALVEAWLAARVLVFLLEINDFQLFILTYYTTCDLPLIRLRSFDMHRVCRIWSSRTWSTPVLMIKWPFLHIQQLTHKRACASLLNGIPACSGLFRQIETYHNMLPHIKLKQRFRPGMSITTLLDILKNIYYLVK